MSMLTYYGKTKTQPSTFSPLSDDNRPGRTKQVGIVGIGKMGILHAGTVNSLPGGRVKAICEKDSFLTKMAKKLLPQTIAFYQDHTKMVENEELDAVFITTPIDSHVPIVLDLAAADQNLSLFVEKPLASHSDQARRACEAVKKSCGIHMVGFQKRFSPVFQRAKTLIQSGDIGDLLFFRAHSFSSDVLREGRSWRFRSGTGGVLLDLAPHLLDMILWMFGEPSSLFAVKRKLYSSKVDDYVHVVLVFESGLRAHMDACWSLPSYRLPEISLELHGTNGSMTVTDDFLKVESGKETDIGSRLTNVYYRQSFDTSLPFLLADPEYTKEDEAFLRAVGSQTLPELNFFEAARVNDLIDRIVESTETARVS